MNTAYRSPFRSSLVEADTAIKTAKQATAEARYKLTLCHHRFGEELRISRRAREMTLRDLARCEDWHLAGK